MIFAHSALPNIQWPPLPKPQAAPMLAMQYQLEQTQWLSPEALQEQQLAQLLKVLHHANKTVPFYQEHFRKANFKPGKNLDIGDLQRIPVLTRDQINEAQNSLTSTQPPAAHGKTFEISTSGSTGKPIKILGTSVSKFYWQAFTLREHLWHRRDASAKLSAIRRLPDRVGQPPRGSRHKTWGPPTDIVLQTGPSSALNIESTITQQISWLQKEKPAFLLTYPSNLIALAKYCQSNSIQLEDLREIRTLGEVVTQEARTLCREVFGVRLTDMYSCQEAGYLALQCPQHEHYHAQSENILLEILDENDRPCAAGQTGRVVISTLHNFATPLIRYEIGDFAVPGKSCACGRGLPVLEEIKGRVRNMLTLPSGNQRWPMLEAIGFGSTFVVRQFQLVQKSLHDIEVKLATEHPLSADKEKQLRQKIHTVLGYSFHIDIHYVDEIPRSKGGKFEDFYSEI